MNCVEYIRFRLKVLKMAKQKLKLLRVDTATGTVDGKMVTIGTLVFSSPGGEMRVDIGQVDSDVHEIYPVDQEYEIENSHKVTLVE